MSRTFRLGRLVLTTAGQAQGAPLIDACVWIERTVTFSGAPPKELSRAGGYCIANPLALRRERGAWARKRWRSCRPCGALVIAWVGWDGPLPRRPRGRAVLDRPVERVSGGGAAR